MVDLDERVEQGQRSDPWLVGARVAQPPDFEDPRKAAAGDLDVTKQQGGEPRRRAASVDARLVPVAIAVDDSK